MRNQQATTNQKNSGKIKRRDETPVHKAQQSPRILAGLHLDWHMFHQEGSKGQPNYYKAQHCNPMEKHFSWISLAYYSLSRPLFPIKSLALTAHVSPWTIHFYFVSVHSVHLCKLRYSGHYSDPNVMIWDWLTIMKTWFELSNNCVSGESLTLWDLQVALMVKNPPVKAGDLRDTGSIPGLA